MALQLFAHNRKAYEKVTAMLARTGKAAVVHPTGTGKSYIAFKLAEERPGENFLWLSPSEYIFRTQLESVKREGSGFSFDNISFLTYARLSQLPKEEIAALKADIIILDEFHRCGARQWGAGVDALLATHPEAGSVGLTATAVRYLDNNRDMAQQLFEGNIASEMTLGEAIVRGILPAPVYVTTVFKYQAELERCQARVNNLRGAGLQEQNRKYLEALRRALEQADGLEEIFRRHMSPDGKYIVFCSDLEHLREMRRQAAPWFAKVNPDIRCYVVYSGDAGTDKEFAAFKKDESSALKLLFCIDMLNEGIHVEGIAGVILFRPTVSPIVYKQQIGRALTAGDSSTPLILDVVNNFEGLCSVSGLEEEMATAVQRLYCRGEGGEIVTERFKIVEQVQNCRLLFERLQNSLANSWDQYFAAASAYAAEFGDLNVPKRYKTATGLSLGSWLSTQRKVRAGQCPGLLTEQQIARLDGIGMVWENRLETAWENGYRHAEEYRREFGDLAVPARYKAPDGYPLGTWIQNLRQQRAGGLQSNTLTPERLARLTALGMEWEALNLKWERNFLAAAHYYREQGDLLVPAAYKTAEGFALGAWIRNLRHARRDDGLTEEQIKRLDAIGMYWGNCHDNRWLQSYRAAERYLRQHGDLDVPAAYRSPEGIALGKWLRRQRYAGSKLEKNTGRLTEERAELLRQLTAQAGSDRAARRAQ